VASRGQSVAQGGDNESPHQIGIAKPDLGFCRVHIHIHMGHGQIDKQSCDGITVAGQKVLLCPANSTVEQLVFDRAAIDKQILMQAIPPRICGQTRKSCQANAFAFRIYGQSVIPELPS